MIIIENSEPENHHVQYIVMTAFDQAPISKHGKMKIEQYSFSHESLANKRYETEVRKFIESRELHWQVALNAEHFIDGQPVYHEPIWYCTEKDVEAFDS